MMFTIAGGIILAFIGIVAIVFCFNTLMGR